MIKRPSLLVHARSYTIDLTQQTSVMGILNCSPDSFSGDGKVLLNPTNAVQIASQMIKDGVGVIDVGGESTRPGAKPISSAVEIKRVVPVIRAILKKHSIPISVDTYKEEVAKQALEAGACIVNTVKGSRVSAQMIRLVKAYDAAIVLMHSRGTSKTMQDLARYRDVVKDVVDELNVSVKKCLDLGLKKNKIIIDPGIGFAKTVEQNLQLIKNLTKFKQLGCPILVGVSRKSFIGKITGCNVVDRDYASVGCAALAISHGANIIRVHHVRAHVGVAQITNAVLKPTRYHESS